MAKRMTEAERAAIAAFPADRVRRVEAPTARARACRPASAVEAASGPVTPAPVVAARSWQAQPMGVWDALQWAVRAEGASVELPGDHLDAVRPRGFGMEHILIERGRLGCEIDGGGYRRDSVPDDAEALVAALSALPERLGGRRVAVFVAETARSGLVPDPMVGAVPRCVPVEWRQRNRNGERFGKSVVVGVDRVVKAVRAGRFKRQRATTVEIRATPVTFSPSQGSIDTARRVYRAWWHALLFVSTQVRRPGVLRRLTVTAAMPPGAPWLDVCVPSRPRGLPSGTDWG